MSKLLTNKTVVIATWIVAAWVALTVVAGIVWEGSGVYVLCASSAMAIAGLVVVAKARVS